MMTASYLPYEPQQQMLLPHALQEWLPEGHLAYYISDTIDGMEPIIVAAELNNNSNDSQHLPAVLAAVKRDAGADPKQVLADARYRSEAVFEPVREHPAKLVVVLGREGKTSGVIDAKRRPLSAAMAEKFKTATAQTAY